MLKTVPCMIFRGGTSKALFFQEDCIPAQGAQRDKFLLKIMGSPDLRQIDGLGGANSLTSKVAIISPSEREDIDVNYTFAQVSVDKAVVDYKGNCGNISSAVGPYSIMAGLVKVSDPETVVRIYNTNTQKVIYSYVQTPNGEITFEGDFAIDGVPGTSAPIKLSFIKPGGSVTGKLLPTGNVVDILDIPGFGSLEASIVDVTNPLVFVRAEDIGLNGTELYDELDSSEELLTLFETIRGVAAQKIGFVDDWRESAFKSPAVPKMTIVSKAKEYTTANGKLIKEDDIDMLGRMMSMQKTHRTYAVTGALCTVAAAAIPGTLVNGIVKKDPFDPKKLVIGHPGGVIQVGANIHINEKGEFEVLSAYNFRTARILMKGSAYY